MKYIQCEVTEELVKASAPHHPVNCLFATIMNKYIKDNFFVGFFNTYYTIYTGNENLYLPLHNEIITVQIHKHLPPEQASSLAIASTMFDRILDVSKIDHPINRQIINAVVNEYIQTYGGRYAIPIHEEFFKTEELLVKSC